MADGRFVAARDVKVGSVLTPQATVTEVTESVEAVINPLTANSQILAAGLEGTPIVAATHPEWIAEVLLSSIYPLPLSLCSALSYFFPQRVQAFYDQLLEPFNNAMSGRFKDGKELVTQPAALLIIALFDLVFGGAFVGYSLAGIEGGLALVAVVVAFRMCRKW